MRTCRYLVVTVMAVLLAVGLSAVAQDENPVTAPEVSESADMTAPDMPADIEATEQPSMDISAEADESAPADESAMADEPGMVEEVAEAEPVAAEESGEPVMEPESEIPGQTEPDVEPAAPEPAFVPEPVFMETPANPAMQDTTLRQRVAVVAVPPTADSAAGSSPDFVVAFEAWKVLLDKEGVTISPGDWATALDATKSIVGKSDVMRVMELPLAWRQLKSAPGITPGETQSPALLLLSRFGISSSGRTAYFKLADPYTGAVMADATATAPDMVQAIRNALAEIEGNLAMMPWRCHVTGVREQQMVIDRGYIDGLRQGNELQGYSMDSVENSARAAMSDEEFLMTHGTKAGVYRVIEVGQNFSKVEPVDNAPVLKAGDILQTPEIRFQDRLRKSRGRSAWDKLYSE